MSKSKIFIITIVLFLTVTVSQAKIANNLEESYALTKSAEGKAAFARGMSGADNSNLGEKLPPNITRDELSQLVFQKSYAQASKATKRDAKGQLFEDNGHSYNFNGLAAYPWPGCPNLYVGIGGIKEEDALYDNNPVRIYITVFKIKKPHDFEIVARNEKPFTFAYSKVDGVEEAFDELVRIDHATFRIAPNEYAFGIRVAYNEGFAGGFAFTQNLILFTVKDKSITPVLNNKIYALQNLAGDWNDDGTRQHDEEEQEWLAVITPTLHNQHFDILIKKIIGGRDVTRLVWQENKYVAR